MLTEKINTYLAIFIITIAGAGASLIIIHVANSESLAATVSGSPLNYLPI